MLKLIILEIKKFKLWNYWKAVVICNIAIFAVLIMTYFIELEEGFEILNNFEMVASFIGVIVRVTFTIFASVLIVKLIVDEYKNKSINLLFSYPIKRKKIFSAKLIIVFAFTFVTVLFSTLFQEGLVLLVDKNFDILPGDENSLDISKHVLTAFMNSIATAGISLIPLLVSMSRKSASATIITSILIATILNSGNGSYNLFSIIGMPLSIGLIGILIGYYSIRNIEKKDLA